MLAGPERIAGEEAVRRDRSRDRVRVNLVVSEYEVVGGVVRSQGNRRGNTVKSSLISITHVRDLGSLVLDEVAHKVRTW